MKLKAKTAIVTGGGSGIGRAIAVRMAREGASVVIGDIDEAGARETAGLIRQAGGSSAAMKIDVADKKQNQRMARETEKQFGRIDILVTSAAVLEETPITEMDRQSWNKTIDTNLTGTLYSVQAVLPVMQRQRYGKIVIISSVAAFRGRTEQSAYCAAAGSLTAFAANTAVQMGQYGICVNCIAPGIVDTDLAESLNDQPDYREFRRAHTPLRRIGRPEDIAGPAVFLSSGDADFITGTTIVADGGLSIYTNGYGL